MTNYSNQDFDAQSFGQPMVEERRGNRAFLFSCGGLSLVALLICCCCAIVAIWGLRRPEAVVAFWGAGAQADWTFAERFVCDNSHAAVLTQRYQEQGATIDTLQMQAASEGEGNTVVATGTLRYQGEAHNWQATFYMLEEGSGFIPLCISNIDVTQGDIVGGADVDNPDVDEENSTSDE